MNSRHPDPQSEPIRRSRTLSAVTLLELLVVVAIIGVLVSIALPAFSGFGEANLRAAAQRQVLDDLGMARLKALNERTTVYMVFVPPNTSVPALVNKQYTSYSLFTFRGVGAQPGQNRPRYLTDWKSLPQGVLFAPAKFEADPEAPNPYERALLSTNLPVADAQGWVSPEAPEAEFRYVAFDSQGRLTTQRDEVITLREGNIFYPQDENENYLVGEEPDVSLDPSKEPTHIRINWLTGRSSLEEPELLR